MPPCFLPLGAVPPLLPLSEASARRLAEAGAATHAGEQQRAEQSASRVATHAGSRNARPSPPPSVRWASAAPSPGGHGRRGPLLLPRSVARAVAMACARRREQRRGRGRVSCVGRSGGEAARRRGGAGAPRSAAGLAAERGREEGRGRREVDLTCGPHMSGPRQHHTLTV